MPSFVFNTNVPSSAFPDNMEKDLTDILHEMLGKPIKFISIHVSGNHRMSFGGNQDPCGLGVLSCLGKIGLEENKQYTQKLMDYIASRLNIQQDRMYISFTNMAGENIGWNGKTFAK